VPPSPRFCVPDDYPPVYQDFPQDLDPLRERGEVSVFTTRQESAEELIGRLQGVTALINVRAYSIFDAPALDALPDLELISVLGTGTDNIDLAAADERGVVVANAPGANAVSVAEHTMLLLLAAARHLGKVDRAMHDGRWEHHLGMELRGKTLGLLGLGAIGREVAGMAQGFGMRVIAWSFRHDPERAREIGVELLDRDEVIRQSDALSLHLRLTPETQNLLGRRELGMMKPGAVLVNTARAALVDEAALIDAVRSGHLSAIGLDVFAPEPLPADSPLRSLENAILTPHLAWVTEAASARLRQVPVENILAYLDGQPQNVVNRQALEHPRHRR
jgi:D-3-phosphoglycerate dehydrogenase / 2-oxoglutarate reductase